MDSGDEGNDIPDDVIETVARVNTMHIEHAPVLPEIRAAPCQIHSKPLSNGQTLKSPRKSMPLNTLKNVSFSHSNASQLNGVTKGHRIDINVRIPEQFPSKQPSLPKNMTSKDYVMTWLIHGSDPQGFNHFPEIIPNNSRTRTKVTPRKAGINE